MMKDDEALQQNNTSHISYKDYKKMLKSNKRNELKLFIGAFFVLLLVFLGIAKTMSPDVDITLGDDISAVEEQIQRGEIDDRLRELQMEDESTTLGNEALSVEDGELVSIPKYEWSQNQNYENKLPEEIYGQKAIKDTVEETNTSVQQPVKQTVTQRVETPQPVPAPDPVVTTQSAKVIVGSYLTMEQAEVAKSILQDAGLGVNPFIRKFGNNYTLQVASYATKDKAMSVAESLLNQNFPARVILE